jgi:uncharacterized protein
LECAWRKSSFHEEASTVFGDPLSLTIPDPEHSKIEDRFVTMGSAFTGKLTVVVHTDRGDNIRIISARRASRRERKSYEKGIE